MERRLRGQSLGTLVLLALQFVLGMILNLLVTLPSTHPGHTGNYFVRSAHSFGWAITIGGGTVLFLHVVVALLLLASSIVLVLRAIASGRAEWLIASSFGLAGILAAFSNGLSFLDFNRDISSFIMAMGFIVAVVSYTTTLTFKGEGRALSARQNHAKEN